MSAFIKSEVIKLSDRQIRKLGGLTNDNDNRARFMEVPSTEDVSKAWEEGKQPMAKLLQGDGQEIGEITLKQAYLCRVFWL